ncbi:MAG TPA: hypothetical protein EYO31_01035 [Phycisphaerales bacterium]|nr:hypothetical protein [Phycisphaerales bacterium]
MRTLLIFTVLLFSSCTPVATYPPVENDTALTFSNSANEPVPTIMAVVISYAHEHFGGMDTVVFNLPEGVGHETYNIVAEKLGGAIPMTSPNEIAYHLTELRVRGFTADADIIFPSASGRYELATVRVGSSLVSPWRVTRDRVWLIPSSEAPAPGYSVETIVGAEADSQ